MHGAEQWHAQVTFGIQSAVRPQIVFSENLDAHKIVWTQNIPSRRTDSASEWKRRSEGRRCTHGTRLCSHAAWRDLARHKRWYRCQCEHNWQPRSPYPDSQMTQV